MPRRVIYIRNPTQGSHFRTIDSDGGPGGGGIRVPTKKDITRAVVTAWQRRPRLTTVGNWIASQYGYGPKKSSALDPIFSWMRAGHQPVYARKVKKGKGIAYQQGIVIGTGGARYKSAASNWFIAPERKPDFGYTIPGEGVGPYEQTFTEFPRDRFGAVDHWAMNVQPPWGTPGTLKMQSFIGPNDPGRFGENVPGGGNFFAEQMQAEATWWGGYIHEDKVAFDGRSEYKFASIPSGYSTLNPNRYDEPSAIMQAWQRGQEQRLPKWDASSEGELYAIFGDVARGAVGFSEWIRPLDPDSPAVQAVAKRMLYFPFGNETAEDWITK